MKKKEKVDCRKGRLEKEKDKKGIENISPMQLDYNINISEPNANRAGHNSTPTTPLPKYNKILRHIDNMLSHNCASLHNMQDTSIYCPPHSPIKQFQIGRLLDETMFGHLIPITLEVDLASPRNPRIDSTCTEEEAKKS